MGVLNPVRRNRRSFDDLARPHFDGLKPGFRANIEQHLEPAVLDAYPRGPLVMDVCRPARLGTVGINGERVTAELLPASWDVMRLRTGSRPGPTVLDRDAEQVSRS